MPWDFSVACVRRLHGKPGRARFETPTLAFQVQRLPRAFCFQRIDAAAGTPKALANSASTSSGTGAETFGGQRELRRLPGDVLAKVIGGNVSSKALVSPFPQPVGGSFELGQHATFAQGTIAKSFRRAALKNATPSISPAKSTMTRSPSTLAPSSVRKRTRCLRSVSMVRLTSSSETSTTGRSMANAC